MRQGEILNGKYEIVSPISLRGFRQKWLASDMTSGNKVVIETLHDDLMNDQSAIESLRYELEVSQVLSGEIFQTCLDTFISNNKLLLVWQHYDYEPLSFALNDIAKGLVSDTEKLTLITKLADGIKYAASKNIVHGQINGDNILVDPKLNPKLINFSKSHYFESTDPGANSILTNQNLVAPEILEGAKPDLLSDIYSLGIIAKILFLQPKDRNYVDIRTLRLINYRPDLKSMIANTIDGLSTTNRELREIVINMIDDDFLNDMSTPPKGIPVVKVSKIKSRKIIRKHKKDNNNS